MRPNPERSSRESKYRWRTQRSVRGFEKHQPTLEAWEHIFTEHPPTEGWTPQRAARLEGYIVYFGTIRKELETKLEEYQKRLQQEGTSDLDLDGLPAEIPQGIIDDGKRQLQEITKDPAEASAKEVIQVVIDIFKQSIAEYEAWETYYQETADKLKAGEQVPPAQIFYNETSPSK